MAFTPWTGNQGIPMIAQGLLDDEITPDWVETPILKANPVAVGQAVIRLLVVAAAAAGVVETYKQVRGDAAADVDDLVSDIQAWLKRQQLERGFARQKRPDQRPKPAALPIRDGETHEDAVLRALDELETQRDFADPGENYYDQPFEPIGRTGQRGDESFIYWLDRRYHRRSVARYLRR